MSLPCLMRSSACRCAVVIPGHGAPFTDVAAALALARSRLEGFRSQPERHARHAVKVMIKYHLMEERRIDHAALLQWAAQTPFLLAAWQRFGSGVPTRAWCAHFVDELIAQGVLAREGDAVVDH